MSKACTRVEAYGSVDELNCHLGVLVEQLKLESFDHGSLVSRLLVVQHELFHLGALLACAKEAEISNDEAKSSGNFAGWARRLEQQIDEFDGALPSLKNFIIPGGAASNAQAHLSRAVCRRVERLLIRFREEEPVEDSIIVYLNRLSDWLFVVARFILAKSGKEESIWTGIPV